MAPHALLFGAEVPSASEPPYRACMWLLTIEADCWRFEFVEDNPKCYLGPMRERLQALDILRGLAVIGMLLVDFPGSNTRYDMFNHAAWLGITLPDFIFPSFLFIVGVTTAWSASHQATSTWRPYWKLLRRTAVLIFLGLVLNQAWDGGPIASIRFPGVLQRIAVVSLAVALIHRHLSDRAVVWVTSCLLVGYWLLLTRVPVPGFGMPNLAMTPGPAMPNLATWLDRTVFGVHVWQVSAPHDPEGLLSTMPAIATGLIGLLAGRWLRRSEPSPADKLLAMMRWGVLLILAGTFWSLGFPFCKNLWTSSFTLFTAGWAMLFLAILYDWVEIKGRSRGWALARWYGGNALAAIVLCTLVEYLICRFPSPANPIKNTLHTWLFQSWLPERTASWVYSVAFILVFGLLFRAFDRKGWHLRA